MAVPGEDQDVTVYSSTQHPSEVQHMVSHALGVPSHAVTVEIRRMGGGFGGKETQGNQFAALAAIAAKRLGRAVKIRPDRDDDMIATGKRHDFLVDYEVGFDDDGAILGVDYMYAARCGFSSDLSGPVTDRALFHCDNAYFYPAVHGEVGAALHQHRIQHGLPRLRRPARHGRRGAGDRRGGVRARQGPARYPQAQFLRHRQTATSRPTTRRSRTTSSIASSPSSSKARTMRGGGAPSAPSTPTAASSSAAWR